MTGDANKDPSTYSEKQNCLPNLIQSCKLYSPYICQLDSYILIGSGSESPKDKVLLLTMI